MSKLTPQILRLYVGQKCTINGGFAYEMQEWQIGSSEQNGFKIKPCLRKLEDITEEDAYEVSILDPLTSKDFKCATDWFWSTFHDPFNAFYPSQFLYLISKGYDIFGLIKSGEAVDIKTIEQ